MIFKNLIAKLKIKFRNFRNRLELGMWTAILKKFWIRLPRLKMPYFLGQNYREIFFFILLNYHWVIDFKIFVEEKTQKRV